MTCGHNRALGAWLQGSRVRIMVGGAPFVEGPQPSLGMGMPLNGLKKEKKMETMIEALTWNLMHL